MVAVIFGASGGIGAAMVAALRGRGEDPVYAGMRSPTGGGHDFAFDFDDEASIARAAQTIGTPVDFVFVATGMLHDAARGIAPEKSFRAVEAAAMARSFAINAIGPALIAKHFLPLLPRDRRAVFALLSARVGSIGDNRIGGWHSYRASKAALNMLVANFAIELRRTHPHAIVAALHPGTVDTALSAPFQRGVAPERLFSPERAAAQLLAVLDGLGNEASGGFFAWDGARIPW